MPCANKNKALADRARQLIHKRSQGKIVVSGEATQVIQGNSSYSRMITEILKGEEQAERLVIAYATWIELCRRIPTDSAKRIALTNLSYFARYYDDGTYAKVMKLIDGKHPIFGKLTDQEA